MDIRYKLHPAYSKHDVTPKAITDSIDNILGEYSLCLVLKLYPSYPLAIVCITLNQYHRCKSIAKPLAFISFSMYPRYPLAIVLIPFSRCHRCKSA